MAQVPLNYGLSIEDGTGDPLRTTFVKIQGNLTDLDSRLQSATSTLSLLGGAARLNVGTVTGTVADGGALASEIARAQGAENTLTTNLNSEISRAQTAEALKAPIASPAFTGVPTAPTAANGTNSTQVATCAFVLSNGGSGSGVPATRQVLAAGLVTGGGDLSADRTFTVTAAAQSDVATGTDTTKALTSFSVAAALGAKAPLASPAFIGTPTAPTATAGTNTTQIATTGFVTGALASYAPLASPALTGNPTAPTQGVADNSTKLATTAYADRAATNAAAAVPPTPLVRQTALSGPSSAGAPSFLPASTGALSITAQNISSSAPLVLTAAQGFNSAGALNTGYAFTSNPTWSGLTASATNFLFVNTSTGATSVSTLAPIYQFGGTISTTNGQFTFDYQAMVGYLGNGSSAVATPLVCVGEAVTSGSAVTSTIAYAYRGFYQSSIQSLTSAGAVLFSHNIGVPIEALDTTGYVRGSGTGTPWLPNPLAFGSTGYPSLAVLNGVSRLQVKMQSGSGGVFVDNSSNSASTATSVDFMVRVRRAW